MARFMPEPKITLHSREETLHALANTEWMNDSKSRWNTKSIWLCQQLDEFEKTVGFPYNESVQSWIEVKERIGPFRTSGSPLSTLIYNAQRYRNSDQLRKQGWQPPTAEILNEAISGNRKVEVLLDSIFGSSIKVCKIVLVNGMYYAIPPRARTKGYVLYDKAVRFPKSDVAGHPGGSLF